jgi:hypothetical protein
MGIGDGEGRIVSRGEMRESLQARPADEVWAAVLGWSVQLQPFWLEAIGRFAGVVDEPVERVDRHVAAAEVAFDRMDDWWRGRAKLVKARRNEIDSAISFIRNTALRGQLRFLVQAAVARHVASGLRQCLSLAAGGYSHAQTSQVVAGLVYTWAECRTMFPGDSAVLLQYVPSDSLVAGSGIDSFDRHHLLYGEPADRFGLRSEADAVYAEARSIWDNFDTPMPWDLPPDLWSRTYDGTYHTMHHAAEQAFHARNRPT